MTKRVRLSASDLRSRSRDEKVAVVAAVGAHVLPHLASGRLHVPVSATYPFRQAADACESFTSGGKLGKIVLVA